MTALFTIAVFGVLFFIGLIGITVGAVGLGVMQHRTKKGIRTPLPTIIIWAVALSIGLLLFSTSVGFGGGLVWSHATPPEGFVETEIVIEEKGYQAERFTADGITYEALGIYVVDPSVIGDAVFTYKVDGFLQRIHWGNYYTVTNGNGFSLVCDASGLLFAPTKDLETVITYYSAIKNMHLYYVTQDDEQLLLTEDEWNDVRRFWNSDLSQMRQRRVVLNDPDMFYIDMMSCDDTIYLNSIWFIKWNDALYFVYKTFETEQGDTEYLMYEVPERYAAPLLAIQSSRE